MSEFNHANFSIQKMIAGSTSHLACLNNIFWFLIKGDYEYQFSVSDNNENHCGPNKDGRSSVANGLLSSFVIQVLKLLSSRRVDFNTI